MSIPHLLGEHSTWIHFNDLVKVTKPSRLVPLSKGETFISSSPWNLVSKPLSFDTLSVELLEPGEMCIALPHALTQQS